MAKGKKNKNAGKKSASRKVAIFDIDGTIFRSSLLSEVTEALIQEEVFSSKVREKYAKELKTWIERQGPYEDYMWAIVKVFDKEIEGIKYATYLKVVKKVVAFHQNRVYRYTRDLIGKLKKENYYLIAISHSPRELVEEFAKKIGFDKMYGRLREVDSKGRITARHLFLDLIIDKSKMLKVAVERHGLTLRGSVGVGDTDSDISFLKMVDHPICFNPNQKLFRYARRNGWTVVVERKDVIYKMQRSFQII